jgi:pilus assembly protein Flp/PilA
MAGIVETLVRFVHDQRGATAIEYGLIAGILAIGMLLAFTFFGGSLSGMFNMVATKGSNAMNG